MRHVFTASRLMTAGEIQKQCKEIRENPFVIQLYRTISEEENKKDTSATRVYD